MAGACQPPWLAGLAWRSGLDGEGELLGRLVTAVVGDPHGEGEGAGRGRGPGELVVGVARVVEGLQVEAGRELPGGERPGVGPGPAAEEEADPEGLADVPREQGWPAGGQHDGQRLVRVHADLVGLVQGLALVARALHGEGERALLA